MSAKATGSKPTVPSHMGKYGVQLSYNNGSLPLSRFSWSIEISVFLEGANVALPLEV
jgi:hypothetical protein